MPEKKRSEKQKYYDSAKDWKVLHEGEEKTIFFTIIADILFGYCNVFAGVKLSSEHKNDLV
jgi:hypothetical protein